MTTISISEDHKQQMVALRDMAQIALKSGKYGQGYDEATMMNIFLTARDLGISPMKALNGGFYLVKGKISMSTALMTDRIRKEGHSVKVVEWTREKCVIIGIRKDNGDSVKVEFTMEDAKLAGLDSGEGWRKYPKAMLYNRAMSMLARVLFPDVVGNCYSEDEGEEINRNAWNQPRKVVEMSGGEEIILTESLPEEEVNDLDMDDLHQKIMETVKFSDGGAFLSTYLGKVESYYPEDSVQQLLNRCLKNPDSFKDGYEISLKKSLESKKLKSDKEVA